jgi:hypothetical protein
MDNEPPDPKPAPRKLISELDRSRDDLAAGRLTPIPPFLTSMQARAASRLRADTK